MAPARIRRDLGDDVRRIVVAVGLDGVDVRTAALGVFSVPPRGPSWLGTCQAVGRALPNSVCGSSIETPAHNLWSSKSLTIRIVAGIQSKPTT